MGLKVAGISQKIAVVMMPVLDGFVTPFLWGLFLWLFGAKAFKGGEADFQKFSAKS